MTQTTSRFFDEVAKLMNDAAGVAQGVRREFDTLMRSQTERMIRDLDLVKREEFDAIKEMAQLARDENEELKARIAALEGASKTSPPAKSVAAPVIVPPPPSPPPASAASQAVVPPAPNPPPASIAPATDAPASAPADTSAKPPGGPNIGGL